MVVIDGSTDAEPVDAQLLPGLRDRGRDVCAAYFECEPKALGVEARRGRADPVTRYAPARTALAAHLERLADGHHDGCIALSTAQLAALLDEGKKHGLGSTAHLEQRGVDQRPCRLARREQHLQALDCKVRNQSHRASTRRSATSAVKTSTPAEKLGAATTPMPASAASTRASCSNAAAKSPLR